MYRVFRGGLQPIRVIPGCLEDVPRMFQGVPGVSRGFQGCSWLVPGFKDTLPSILSNVEDNKTEL